MRAIVFVILLLFSAFAEQNPLSHSCDLNSQACALGKNTLWLQAKDPVAMQENYLILKSELKEPRLEINGISMDMGKMPILKQQIGDEIRFKFIPSSCIMHSKMLYEIKLFDGDRLVGTIGQMSVKN